MMQHHKVQSYVSGLCARQGPKIKGYVTYNVYFLSVVIKNELGILIRRVEIKIKSNMSLFMVRG